MRQPWSGTLYLPVHVVRLPRRRGTRRLGSHQRRCGTSPLPRLPLIVLPAGVCSFAAAAAHDAGAIRYASANSVRLPRVDARSTHWHPDVTGLLPGDPTDGRRLTRLPLVTLLAGA
ncbi:hypothetical protein AURDEDRAFT_178511 [Auricularia subglabra TFB-10046 SS5]|uniref:Uncharacterized protein n=1 Tax=Auricularia subglabra (strain TFB-10046 / SS5) TaxID=717982 RepID=J0WKY8_AURST|nr:hypothetical protein AURDEDRAFT_178511 [Auricularia subglabra TFB-10046 SS5]